MAYSRRLGVIGILGVCFFVAVGCDDSDDKNVNEAEGGEAGETGSNGGSGGKSTAGSQNNAGKGGKGTGGSAGSPTAGTAGAVNGGGEGGTAAESTGGMGGEGNTAPLGGAGADGGGGEPGGGAGGAPDASLKACTNECEIDDDCAVLDSPVILSCDQATHRCVDALEPCETNDNCVPWVSLWYTPCTKQADCTDSFCVTWEGKGYCANAPSDDFCFPPWTAPSQLLEFGSADPQMFDVCFGTGATCNAGKCIASCADPFLGGCDGNGDTCNEVSGLCECETGDSCASGVCGADSHCVECVTSDDCAENAAGNTSCFDGKCGCGSADSCPDDTQAGTPVCE
jgi:hypothetical protein